MELDDLDPKRMPRHVACVMDGNGRWAAKRGLPRTEGHRAGEEALLDAVKGALELRIEWFTVYAFSTENWRRPQDEVRFLLSVIADDLLTRRRDELHELGSADTFCRPAGLAGPEVDRPAHGRDDGADQAQHEHHADRGVQLRRAGRDSRRRAGAGRPRV